MQLELTTTLMTETATVGELKVDGVFECFTLEDTVRPLSEKIMHKTAIPAGKYQVVVNYSPRFGKFYPRLLDVPNFTGILIHSGNNVDDTSGCILVGDKIDGERIAPGTSSPAFKRLFKKINDAVDKGDHVWIHVKRGDQ